MVEDLPSIDVPQGVHNSKDMLSPEILGSSVLSPSHNSEVSDSRTGSSDGFSESVGTSSIIVGAGMVESFPHSGIVEHQCSRTVTDCISVQENCLSHICMVDGPQSKTPSYFPNHGDITPCGTPSHSGPLNSSRNSCVTHDGESSAVCQTNHDQDLFECSRLDFPFENTEDASIIDGEMTPHDASHNESSSCEIKLPDVPGSFPENGGINLFELDDPPYVSFSSGFQPSCDGNRMVNAKDEVETSNDDFVCLMPSVDLSGSQFCNHMPENGTGGCVPSNDLVGFSYVNDMITMQDESKDISPNSFFCIFNRTEDYMVVNKNVQSIRYNEIEVVDEVISRKSYGDANKLTSIEGIQWSPSDSSLIPCKNYVSSANDEKDNGFVLSALKSLNKWPERLPRV